MAGTIGFAGTPGGFRSPSGAISFGVTPEALASQREGAFTAQQLATQQEQLERRNKISDRILNLLLGKGGEGGLLNNVLDGGRQLTQPGGPDAVTSGGYGAGERARLEQDFQTLSQNVLGQLESRGLGGSSLVASALTGVEREKQLSSGELEDRLFREQLQFRTAERQPLYSLLGSLIGGI